MTIRQATRTQKRSTLRRVGQKKRTAHRSNGFEDTSVFMASRNLEQMILDRSARIGILGLGYVGLPESVMFAQAGFPVTGFDVDFERVQKVNAGESYIADVPSEVLASLVAADRLRAMPMPSISQPLLSRDSGEHTDSIPQAFHNPFSDQDCLCICVPTPLRQTRDPDISYIVGAVEGFQRQLRRGHLVILESTTYPGTTEEVVQPMLEATGLRAGADFHLAFSPERVNPGDSLHPPASIPKVVGGLSPACTRLASLLYEQVVSKVLTVSSPRAAEMVKLLENTFRSVNIGLVNELALMCDRFNLNVWEIIDAAASKPFGFMPFYPGPGLGDHCIPVDPFYLSWKAHSNGFEARFIELAGQVNGYMPKHVVHRIADALNGRKQSLNGSRILILGVAYKPDVSDTRESPALEIIHLLREQGAYVLYHDPNVPELRMDGEIMKSLPLSTSPVYKKQKRSGLPLPPVAGFRSSDVQIPVSHFDCAVIVTHHSAVDYRFLAKEARLIVDTRNAMKDVPFGRDKIIRI